MDFYDVDKVKEEIQASLAKHQNNPEDARLLFRTNIMDWTDHFTENLQSLPENNEERSAALNNIARLWIEYAAMEIALRQFKTAVQVFEDALMDPVAKNCVQIYLAFAEHCRERKKLPKAQKVYISGINAGLSQSNIDCLWREFLSLVRSIKGTGLSLKELFDAAKAETNAELAPPSSFAEDELIRIDNINKSSAVSVSNSSISAIDHISDSSSISVPLNAASALSTLPSVVAAKNENGETMTMGATTMTLRTTQLTQLEDLTGYTPEELCKVHWARPDMLFSSPNKEPIVNGLTTLSPEEWKALECFFGVTLIGGQPIQTPDKPNGPEVPLGLVLDVLEALWIAQALKERHFDSWFSDLKILQRKEDDVLRKELSDSHGDPLNETKIKNARNRWDVQMEMLNAIVNKTMLAMLLEQLHVLTVLNIPFFSESLFHKIQTSSKSAPTVDPETKAPSRLPPSLRIEFLQLRKIGCALLSLRLAPPKTVSTVRGRPAPAASPAAPPSVTTVNNEAPTLVRSLSVGSESSLNDTQLEDYYSQEAKKRRKKRRILASSVESVPGSAVLTSEEHWKNHSTGLVHQEAQEDVMTALDDMLNATRAELGILPSRIVVKAENPSTSVGLNHEPTQPTQQLQQQQQQPAELLKRLAGMLKKAQK